jgi:MFS family permease
MDPVARQLIIVRFLRAIAQGALAVDFTLYLGARHWNAPEIGLLLMSGGLFGALLSLVVGVTSDRVGRRVFLLVYEAGLFAGTLAIVAAPSTWVIAGVAALFGFGRGANGSSGPFAPAEQAWLAQALPSARRGAVFSLNAGMQFWGMGIGSLLAAVLPHMIPGAAGAAAYLPLFLLNLMVAAINLVQIWLLAETMPGKLDETGQPPERSPEESVTRKENRALALLTFVNMINSLGVGLVAPLLPYWFSLRFGVGPEAIGPVYALTFFLTGASSLVIGQISERIGLVRSIVLPRLVGVVLLLGIPFMPSFLLAAVLYVVRSVLNRGSVGARQAFSVGLVRDRRRGLASSLNAVSWNVPAAIGPAIAGWLIGMGSLVWPFVLAGGLQLGYVTLFPALMGRYDVGPARARDTA